MTFVSYSQNLEDVMLWRALQHVSTGFYVDVGAYSPCTDSVTKAFYDRGWYGINIEPNASMHSEFARQRPRDINLCLAASDKNGVAQLYVVEDTGLTTVQSGIAHKHGQDGRMVDVVEVPTRTLSTLLNEHTGPGQPVHFLKIDVEGHEATVLKGLDLKIHRPWVLLIEATIPATQIPSHAEWEPDILASGYRFVHWDGLNRFYVADEHPELVAQFSAPPNVFDRFVTSREQQANEALVAMTSQLQKVKEAAAEQLAMAEKALLRAQKQREYLPHRTIWEKILFQSDAKPGKFLSKLLFHKNGKPRGMFRPLVLDVDGQPRKAFLPWMTSDEYQSLKGRIAVNADKQQ